MKISKRNLHFYHFTRGWKFEIERGGLSKEFVKNGRGGEIVEDGVGGGGKLKFFFVSIKRGGLKFFPLLLRRGLALG